VWSSKPAVRSAGEWQYVRATVRRPDPVRNGPGELKEGRYCVEGDTIWVEDKQGRRCGTERVQPGDDFDAAARKILCETHDRHGSFYDPISYRRVF